MFLFQKEISLFWNAINVRTKDNYKYTQQILFCKLSPQKQNIDRTAYQIAKYNCGAATTACFAMYIYCLLALYMLCKNKKQNVALC
jgi:hypothetical protein